MICETAKARVIVERKTLIGGAASQVEQDVVFTVSVFHRVRAHTNQASNNRDRMELFEGLKHHTLPHGT